MTLSILGPILGRPSGSFVGALDRAALLGAADRIVDLVAHPGVAAAWATESARPGLTVGGLVRHLVSQPECAVEFLASPVPPGAATVTLSEYVGRLDWLDAGVEAPENTSIRDDFNAMAAGGQEHSVAILEAARAALPDALAGAGAATYVPWQDCALPTDDFLAVRLLEVVVHADDLAASLGVATPTFDDAARDPVLALLTALSVRRHGEVAVLRTLARRERAAGSVSAF